MDISTRENFAVEKGDQILLIICNWNNSEANEVIKISITLPTHGVSPFLLSLFSLFCYSSKKNYKLHRSVNLSAYR